MPAFPSFARLLFVVAVAVAVAVAGSAAVVASSQSLAADTGPRVLLVGPDRELKTPSAAAGIAQPGDTVRIDAGDYADCAVWQTPDLTIEGPDPKKTGPAGGVAHMRNTVCEDKAIWVFYRAPVTIRHITFSGARSARRNGAGIRWEGGGRLAVHNSVFADNQMGILTHNRRASRLVVSDSRFEGNGACDTFCGHALYAGLIDRLTVWNSVFSGHFFGHHIKSRALVSNIVGNSIEDGATGTSSYAINLPNSGTALLRDNRIQKGPLSDNPGCAICIGEEIAGSASAEPRQTAATAEAAKRPRITMQTNPSRGIVVERNRLINETGHADTALVWNRGPHEVSLKGNILTGPGRAYYDGPKPDPETPTVDPAK